VAASILFSTVSLLIAVMFVCLRPLASAVLASRLHVPHSGNVVIGKNATEFFLVIS
jgi:hypothetical protein